MKKETMENVVALLKDNADPKAVAAVAELTAELGKNAEKAAKNKAVYDKAKAVVLGVLTDKGITLAEWYDEVKGDLPEGFTKAKMQYAITHYWNGELTKIDGNPCTYVQKA